MGAGHDCSAGYSNKACVSATVGGFLVTATIVITLWAGRSLTQIGVTQTASLWQTDELWTNKEALYFRSSRLYENALRMCVLCCVVRARAGLPPVCRADK